jgi:3-phytase
VRHHVSVLILSSILLFGGCSPAATAPPTTSASVAPSLATASVAHDPDDPAIWISHSEPQRSLILATDKVAAVGGLYVFGLDGRRRQVIAPLDRPNNVDVEYGLSLGERTLDIAVVTERLQHRLRVFGIPADGGPLLDLNPRGISVLAGESGERREPMGIALYRRPSDQAIFAIVAPKTGDATNYLWQYRLSDDGAGGVKGTFVRRFGQFGGNSNAADGQNEIEAVVVDDALGYVYYSDEAVGIRKYVADPDAPDAGRELSVFGTEAYLGDREGLAVYPTGTSTGYIVSSDQVPNGTRLLIYPREGTPDNPHQHPCLAVLPTESDATDGLDATSVALPGFPSGLLVMMNSGPKNFLIYNWQTIADRIGMPNAAASCHSRLDS